MLLDYDDEKVIEGILHTGIINYALQNDIYVNVERLDKIISGLIKNYKKYGDFYCPCKIITDNKFNHVHDICPCVKDDMEYFKKYGHCRCNLFVA